MPMWQIYHHTGVFSDEDKAELSQRITALYPFLPPFYVNVHFHELSRESFFNGGSPADDFVSIQVDHVARQMNDKAVQKKFVEGCRKAVQPTIDKHNLRWEFYIDQTPTELWLVNGLVPPEPDSNAEKKWKVENRTTPY